MLNIIMMLGEKKKKTVVLGHSQCIGGNCQIVYMEKAGTNIKPQFAVSGKCC